MAQPFCTISAAANAAQPGQTVRVLYSLYTEQVNITHSGTQDQPITIVGAPLTNSGADQQPLVREGAASTPAFVLSNVHDVAIRGLQFGQYAGFDVTNSSRITVDQNTFAGDPGRSDIHVSGASDHVTVSRNLFQYSAGVAIDSGAHDVLVTSNDFWKPLHTAIAATDSPNLAATNNTVNLPCGRGVELDGASTGAVVENDVIVGNDPSGSTVNQDCSTATDFGIVLSAGSTAGSKVDYNALTPVKNGAAYSWGGAAYATPAALAAPTGQGTHDVEQALDINSSTGHDQLTDGDAAAIDSADPTAPGVGTDLFGEGPVNDPNVSTKGPAGSVRDRGAYEVAGLTDAQFKLAGATVTSPQGPAPFTVTTSVAVTNRWNAATVSYTFDFGDGTDPVVSSTPNVTHVYANPGTYPALVTVTDALGGKYTNLSYSGDAVVNPPGDLVANLALKLNDSAGYVSVSPTATSPYVVNDLKVDYGDGTVKDGWPGQPFDHIYHAPGTYTVKLTATDQAGRTATTSQQIQVVYDLAHQVLLPGERVQVDAQTSDSLLNTTANYTQGLWAGFAPIGGWNQPFIPSQVTSVATAWRGGGYSETVALAGGKIYGVGRDVGPDPTGETGNWEAWQEITGLSQAGPLANVIQVAAAQIDGQTHIVALAGGRVYETKLIADSTVMGPGRWVPWGDVTAAAGLPDQVTQIAAAGSAVADVLHIAALGSDGHVRIADGDYSVGRWSFGDLTGYIGGPGSISQISVASIGSKFHVLAVSDGDVYQATADYSAGTWTSFANVSAVVGLRGAVTQVAAAATGNTLHLYGVSGGHIYNANGDYNLGAWSPWADVTAPGAGGTTAPITFVSAAGLF